MSNIKVELDSNGIAELMKSDDVASYVESIGEKIMSKCTGNYKVESYLGKDRTHTKVYTNDDKTYYKQFKTNELLNAVGGRY